MCRMANQQVPICKSASILIGNRQVFERQICWCWVLDINVSDKTGVLVK